MSHAGDAQLRELLFAGEEIVRADWAEMNDATPPDAAISRGNAADSALDRIAQIGSDAIDRKNADGVVLALDSLARLYADAEQVGAPSRSRWVADHILARRRREIALRAYIWGALAAYQGTFEYVRQLVLQPPGQLGPTRLWLRAAVTSLCRSNQFPRKTLLPLVADYVSDRDVVFRRFRGSKDDVVNALCQFDFLQCVVAVIASNDVHACYPNFGAYHNERTEPVIARLIADEGIRRSVVGNVSDERLASAIREIDRIAGELFFSFAGWDSGWWQIPAIREFLARFATS